MVKDKLGKVNLPVILEANTHAAEISLVSIGTAGVSDTRASVVVSSNAADGAASLSVETYSFGTWSKANIISSAANSRHKAVAASKNYTLTFSIPAAVDDLPVRVKFKDTVKATGTIKKHGALLELESENYVFGSYATFKLKCASATPASSLHFFAASSGSYAEMSNVSVDAANGRVTIKGFTPGTRYSVKASETASASDASAPVTITTEKALQLPDSDMENWYYTDSESHWKRYFLGTQTATYWGTNNPMTTGEGGNFAYVRISGTAPGDGGHSGKCAVISTQGWGKGNTAVGSYTGAVCHYVDPGLLHLGSSRSSRAADIFGTSDLDCGLAFASRPSALKFWAKYAPVNSADEALALAQVFDASGNVIASGQLIITKQDAFTEKSIPLTYAAGAAKAAKIYVKFLSTHLENGVSKNKNWVTPPPFGGDMGNGQYHGARLYVDDLSLSY